MKKLSLHIAITFLILTGTTSLVTRPAMAALPDSVVGAGAAAVQCTASVQYPYRSGQFIYGSGSIACSRTATGLALIVCVESSPTGTANTFVPAGCASDQRTNASSASATAFAPCAPVPMHYRTWMTVSATDEDGPRFNGTFYSDSVVKSCA